MVDKRKEVSPEALAEMLFQNAVVVLGQERAQILRSDLEQTAKTLHKLSRHDPGKEVEPGFYL